MAGGKKRPGERRRVKKRKRQKAAAPDFHRPVEWARAELVGVQNWLVRLKGPKGEAFPEGWQRGQIKHYTKHAHTLRAEIKATVAAAAAADNPEGDGPKAA